jgi:hypothetical protein
MSKKGHKRGHWLKNAAFRDKENLAMWTGFISTALTLLNIWIDLT